MDVDYDPAKRSLILADRGLDLADAGKLFDGFHLTRRDDKHSETEERFHSIGMIGDEVVIVTWTLREDRRRIVTMWKANDRERQKYQQARDRPG
ncbi:BrnT family toxin [Sphingomonas sp.]|jgi:hypothetical protein|uniref:BrnT family toxin n=1 Tax=Sphingomonas sp. TaxID=28214 RepID=UPI002E33C20E|nr:BrnT family toxin [Sphingomonas sp.]HEX4694505.1 BrnT family toxin [Sphingomonas sp.]